MFKTPQKQIICPNPNCGYRGIANATPRANVLFGLILFFFFIVPGILYAILFRGYRYSCPICGMHVNADV